MRAAILGCALLLACDGGTETTPGTPGGATGAGGATPTGTGVGTASGTTGGTTGGSVAPCTLFQETTGPQVVSRCRIIASGALSVMLPDVI